MQHEEWRPVPGHEGVYEISSIGRARSLERLNSRGYRQPAKMLKTSPDNAGYPVFNLCKDGICVKARVHVLVCTVFNGPKPDDIPHAQVRHLDGNPGNNVPSNLKWGTYAEQRQDDLRNGRNQRRGRTHCPQGHEYTPENTYRAPSKPTSRCCKRCARDRYRRSRLVA